MRQESRFISVARSGVGAQGLMQVMPATGKWVAGKLGLKGYSLSWLRDPDTNVMIGTNYMRLILEGWTIIRCSPRRATTRAGRCAALARHATARGRSTRRPFPSTKPATTSRR